MENHSDFLPFENNDNFELLEKYEQMKAVGEHYYFDVEEFEELLDYYLFHPEKHHVSELIDYAKNQHPDSTAIILKEAEVLVYSERIKEAVKIAESVELFEDSNPEHFFSKASIFSMADEKERAIEILTYLVEISDADADDKIEATMALAKEYQEFGDYEKAVSLYQEIIKQSPGNEDAILEISLSCELSFNYALGIQLLNEFIDENPYSAYAWFALGNLYITTENNEKAIESLEYATLINAKFTEAFFNLGTTHMKMENFEKSIEAFKETISVDLPDPISLNLIGHCYILLEDYKKSIPFFKQAVEQSPDYGDGWLGLAVSYSNLENQKESILHIETAIKTNPDNIYYQHFLGDALFNLEDYEKAETVYKKVYDSATTNDTIYLDYSEVLMVNEKYTIAQDVLMEGITKAPDEAALYYRYTALMLILGQKEDAESILYLALEIDPKQTSQLFDMYPDAVYHENIMDLIENYT